MSEYLGNPEAAEVSHIKNTCEDIFKNEFGDNSSHTFASQYKGRLSVDANNPVLQTLQHEDLYDNCSAFCFELQEKLADKGIAANIVMSADPNTNGHQYLEVRSKNMIIAIDPTIGQYILGHNHTFVGMRQELRNLVINKTGPNYPYSIGYTRSKDNPLEAFQRIWGEKSKILFRPDMPPGLRSKSK